MDEYNADEIGFMAEEIEEWRRKADAATYALLLLLTEQHGLAVIDEGKEQLAA